jgi:DNA-binding MarR family transcriptional regulator
MKREETIDHHIKSAWHAISRMYNHQAAKHDFTTAMGFVLLIIDSKNGTPATKIAPLLGLEARSLTRMLKVMEEKEMIYKEPDSKDGRSVRIFLTQKGKVARAISRQTVIRFNEYIRESIDPEKLKIFFEVIGEINRIVEEENMYDGVKELHLKN